MSVTFIVVLAGLIKCCAVHTPSSNPKRPPARRLQDTFYYVPMTTARRVGSAASHAASSTLRRMRHHGHHHGHGGGVRVPGYASTAAAAASAGGGGGRLAHQHELVVVGIPARRGNGAVSDAEAGISLAPALPRHGGRGPRQQGNLTYNKKAVAKDTPRGIEDQPRLFFSLAPARYQLTLPLIGKIKYSKSNANG